MNIQKKIKRIQRSKTKGSLAPSSPRISLTQLIQFQDFENYHLHLFNQIEKQSLFIKNSQTPKIDLLLNKFQSNGILSHDSRLSQQIKSLQQLQSQNEDITIESLESIFHNKYNLLEQFLSDKLAVPQFGKLSQQFKQIFQQVKDLKIPENCYQPDYIPYIKQHVKPGTFAASLCTIDGQHVSIGNCSKAVCLHAVANIVTYGLALQKIGPQTLNQRISVENSGEKYNSLSLTSTKKPHNALINAGAMLCSSLIDKAQYKQSLDEREESYYGTQLQFLDQNQKQVQSVGFEKKFDQFIQTVKDLSGSNSVAFSNQTCLSEAKHSFRNRALLHFMKAQGALKKEDNIDQILQFFLNTQAIKTNTTNLAVLAASLANGGKCPIDDKGGVFQQSQTTKCVLTQMLMAGLNTYSGEWGFMIGLPAKSSISGITLMVVPNLLGVCVLSPPVDSHGNSWKGIEFLRRFTIKSGFSKMETIYCGSKEKVRNFPVYGTHRAVRGMQLMLYIANGDLSHVKSILVSQTSSNSCINYKDFQGNTPLDLAQNKGFKEIVKLLKRMGAQNGSKEFIMETSF